MISRGTFSKNVVRFGLIDSFLQLNDTSRLVFNYLSNNFEILIYHSSFFLERLISGESNQKNTTNTNTTRSLCSYSFHPIFKHLSKDAKSYLSFGLGLQGGIMVIINTLVLVSIKQTNQYRKASLKTTILLSVHATSFTATLMLFFSNYHAQDCNVSTTLLSVNIYFSQLNTSLMCFISLDRFLHVRFSRNYQRQFKTEWALFA